MSALDIHLGRTIATRQMTAAELRGYDYALASLITWFGQMEDGSGRTYTTREIQAHATALQRGAARAHHASTRGRSGGT